MKKGLLLLVFISTCLTSHAQRIFGNEWIKPNQKYLKFSVNQAGVYRVGYDDLKAIDPAFVQTNPINWQLFFRGQEVAIRVVGQQDGVFNTQDYVEFYGEGNDGSQDSLLYRPQKRLHPYQTLYSDKAAYFLTSSPTLAGKRMPELTTSAQGLTPEAFHIEETVQAFTSDYTFNNLKGVEPAIQESYFEPGEGWSGPMLTKDSVGIVRVNFTNRVNTTAFPIALEGMINGRDNTFSRQIQVSTPSTQIATLTVSGFASQTFQSTINPTTLQNEQLTLRFTPQKIDLTNNFSITYVKVNYPQAVDMAGQTSKVFHIPANARQSALLSLKNGTQPTIAYDITDKINCRYITAQTSGDQTLIVASETTKKRDVFVTSKTLKPLTIQVAHFSSTFAASTTYLIITHASLKQSANTYAAYRASEAGGGHKPLIVEADSLFDQFNYGDRSPLALRRFADYMLANTAVKNLLLIGRACSYPYLVKTTPNDLVPTIGYPGSDILLTAGLNGFPTNTHAIPTGRLNVTTNDQVLAYLDKVKQLEGATANDLWRKHIIHISGGKTKDEAQSLRTALTGVGNIYTNGQLGGEISAFSKSTTNEVEYINISPLVNDGVSMITFFGHAGPSVTDMNFGFASPPENGFANTRYPLLIFNGCGVGEIFSNFTTMSTDWLLTPNKGAAIVLAHSYWSYEQPTTQYLTKLYSILYTDATSLGTPFGKVQQQVNLALDKAGNDPYNISVALEMILQGDPAVVLYPLPNPDFSVDPKGMYLQSSVIGSSIQSSDSLRVVMPMANLGKFVAGQSVSVSLKKTTSSGTTTIPLGFTAFRYRDTLVYTIRKDETLQKLELTIDPSNQITELSKTNNTSTLTIDWSQAQNGSSYPLQALPDRITPEINVFIDGAIKENKAVVRINPELEIFIHDENPLSPKDSTAVDVYLKSCSGCDPQKLSAKTFSVSAVSANQLQVKTTLSLQAGGAYQLIVFGKDAAGNRTQPPYTLDIVTLANDQAITLKTYPNPASTYVKFELNLNVLELPAESRLTIYNQTGVPVFNDTFSIATGKNLLLWQGMNPGLYPYSLKLTWKDGRTEVHTGKVSWQP
ncbi:putative type IX secretion system sortase PorU2 [Spirosoma foliorum]|uniref:Gingipain domain-containing protein n=1 Tax=Spirosoma foliorum TaxID=2710596 RepID=A0A7G5GRV1_9BACT|nr:C25 family cysteine peptidase [Spirosoma foliorum]QMW01593.1 hypothetical protein H3H32_27100 [Spirosoma foliorum]